ncbi:hypothetical protein WICPIJ_006247 [Wickerhamomyces pijperi]|uniref:Uncharacterized protein n=1 Tax=Wickerhamomyces pijperi TaxID=599730 RepID=A0A9P8TKD8_WICPI|nr:hypothetical protein WICPIJ_006247 [Wickerhamomyces pijperi]
MSTNITQAQANINHLLTTPNINTSYLNQIHKSNSLIQAQSDQLQRLTQGNLQAINSRYEKIMGKVLKRCDFLNRDLKTVTESAQRGEDERESDVFESIQHMAELCDLRLRSLETCVKIIDGNETLRYDPDTAGK